MTATVVGELEHGGRYIEFHYEGYFYGAIRKIRGNAAATLY
jgi:S-adenosylmethionine:tRNA ribosyltransferase-isomerase